MNDLSRKILFTVACLILPVVWGVFVNWLFSLWQTVPAKQSRDEPVFPDYQI